MYYKLIIIFFINILAISSFSNINHSISSLKNTAKTFNAVAEEGISAVVSISATMPMQGYQNPMYNDPFFRQFFDMPNQPRSDQKREGIGSGVLISSEGMILTNHHVIENTSELFILLSDGREFSAQIIGTDPNTDLALLKIDSNNLPFLTLGNSDTLQVGDWAIAVGNPFGLQSTVTVGIISGLGRAGVVDQNNYASFIQTDAAINPGNSGGALLNIEGELIGINTAIFSRSGGYMGIGFAVPVSTAKRVMEDILKYGQVKRGILGVTIKPINDSIYDTYQLKSKEGAFVVDVEPHSSADKAGIQKGDVIIELNEKKVSDFLTLRSRISELRIGDKSKLIIIRDGKQKTLYFTLLADKSDMISSPPNYDKLGLSLSRNSIKLQKKYNLYTKNGLVITSVKPHSIAAKNMLEEGYVIKEVNGYIIESYKDYIDIITQSDVLLFSIDVDGYHYRIMLKN